MCAQPSLPMTGQTAAGEVLPHNLLSFRSATVLPWCTGCVRADAGNWLAFTHTPWSLVSCAGMAWAPSWDVLLPGSKTQAPDWWFQPREPGPSGLLQASRWRGLIPVIFEDPLLTSMPPKWGIVDWQHAFLTGQGIPAHPTQPNTLRTVCLIFTKNHKTFLKANPMFKLVTNGSGAGQESSSKGYLRLMANAVPTCFPNTHEVYLHRLLCFLYNGPPPDGKPWVGHLCGHKLCLCPWHLAWMDNSENLKRYHAKKKRRVYQP